VLPQKNLEKIKASKLSDITGKKLVLSGILANQISVIQEAFDPWIQLKLKDEMDGWVLLEGSL
jgi:ribosomal protein L11 methylase PrmA